MVGTKFIPTETTTPSENDVNYRKGNSYYNVVFGST
jgi:hypothetical protein